ncbi:hypothetical protein [Nakamurella aerolata]|uniref:Uncharacterized protein n=1 Tax=Nakamurella aerolata TaxID=1656892 RepID=A0A849ACG3_9ACTN|nr:hypothetical protein [Nakamurella aerolata]NNG36861.1 hypothetical protein [Nakamurella aerolata]
MSATTRTALGGRLAGAALAVALLTLTACSDPVAGDAESGYQPPAIDKVRLTQSPPPGGEIIAISADGSRTVAIDNNKVCSVRGTDQPVCAQLPDDGPKPAVALAPAGDRYVVFTDPRTVGYPPVGGAWIVAADTGKATTIELPRRTLPSGRGAGAPSPTEPSGSAPGGSAPSGSARSSSPPAGSGGPDLPELMAAFVWGENDTLYGVTIGSGVVQVNPADGSTKQLVPGATEPYDVLTRVTLAGSTLVTLRRVAPNDTRLVSLTLPAGTPAGPQVPLGEGQPLLLGASPDGQHALVSKTDLQRFLPGETSVVDLKTGAKKTVPGTADAYTMAGGYSPDGSLIALVTANKKNDSRLPSGFTMALAPADGSAAPRPVGDPGKTQAYGGLRWNTKNPLCTDGSLIPEVACWTLQ